MKSETADKGGLLLYTAQEPAWKGKQRQNPARILHPKPCNYKSKPAQRKEHLLLLHTNGPVMALLATTMGNEKNKKR